MVRAGGGARRRASPAQAVAALPMYDLPGLQGTNDALWAAIAGRLRSHGLADVPPGLTRGRALGPLWRDPRLLLSQTCGYPYVLGLHGALRLVATPGYRAHGCDGPFHRSVILVRGSDRAQGLADLRGARLALNDADSNTGMNLLRFELAAIARGQAFFREVVVTGAHAASAAALAEGVADLAAVDCVTWAHLQRLEPALSRKLRVLAWTARSPGLPFVTHRLAEADLLAALLDALDAVTRDRELAEIRKLLLLDRVYRLPEAHYRAVLYFEQMAADLGYASLR